MTIIERTKVLAVYGRARSEGAEHAHACATVADELGLLVEAVHDAVTEEVEADGAG